MRVRIEFTLDVDVPAYRAEYGEDLALDTVRRQVISDAIGAALEQFERAYGPGAPVGLAAPRGF